MHGSQLHRLLKGLSGSSRLLILACLKRRGHLSVSDIARVIHRSVTTTSIQLSHLERVGILKRIPRNHSVLYRFSTAQHPLTREVLRSL